MKTANLAIVFTDIKGFTARTSQQTHEENQRMLRVHDALLTPVFKAFGGRLVKTIGDAFLVVFESPTQAVLGGVAVQDRLWDYNRRVPESEQIHVRIAVNMGEVRVERGDVFGEPVNIASRVEGLADAGEVLFTEAVYLAMNKAEVPSEDRGVHALKGIPEPVRVYRVPQGGYRLAAADTRSERVGDAPPYGGYALSKAGELPEPDPQHLVSSGELMDQLGAAASQLAGRAVRRAEGFWQRGSAAGAALVRLARARAGGRWLVPVAGLAAFGLLVLSIGILTTDPIERTIRSGDFTAARQEIRKLERSPRRTYLEGRLSEEKKDFGSAAAHYAKAAGDGGRKAYRRLIALTGHDSCSARQAAAYALGGLGDPDALSALRDLEDSDFDDEGGSGDNVLGKLFGCHSKRAARHAIELLEARKE